ncbi:MAG: YtxH domain-containing protein [Bacteroidota bacterium]
MGKILIGVMAGVIIGMLIAPDKGSVTLEKITGMACDDLKEKFNDFISGIGEKIKENANDLADQAKASAQDEANKSIHPA